MTKWEFLSKLQTKLYGLPQNDIDERLAFYSEMIDDRMEEGLTEAEAVAAIGTVDDVVSQILSETSLRKIIRERIRLNSSDAKETTSVILRQALTVLGAVVLLLGIVVANSVLWVAVASLWAIDLSLAAGAIVGIAQTMIQAVGGNATSAFAMLGIGLACAGFTILMFYAGLAAARGVLEMTKRTALDIKYRFIDNNQ